MHVYTFLYAEGEKDPASNEAVGEFSEERMKGWRHARNILSGCTPVESLGRRFSTYRQLLRKKEKEGTDPNVGSFDVGVNPKRNFRSRVRERERERERENFD